MRGNIILSGARGFIGHHLITALAQSHEIIALQGSQPTPSTSNTPLKSPQVHWLSQDLTQPLNVAALPARIDAVIHLAQSNQYRNFPDGAADIAQVNVDSTWQLAEYARRAQAQTFIYTSTGSIYQRRDAVACETDLAIPPDFYSATKLAAEILLKPYEQFLNVACLRLFTPYGAGQARQMLLPRLVERLLAQDPIQLSGKDGLSLSPIYVADVVQVIAQCLTLTNSVTMNVAGEAVVTLRALLDMMGNILQTKPQYELINANTPAPIIAGDISRLRNVFPALTFTDLSAGIQTWLQQDFPTRFNKT